MIKNLLLLILLLSFNCALAQKAKDNKLYDSIIHYLDKSEDYNFSKEERISFAKKAKDISIKIGNDSLVGESFRKEALTHYAFREFNLFKKTAQQYLKHSIKVKDSFNIGKAYNYLGFFYRDASVIDSAYYYYYQAEKVFRKLNNSYQIASQLLSLATIQNNEKDFIGAEILCVEAISMLNKDKDKELLSKIYNALGIAYNELGQYEESIKYHKKRLKIQEELNTYGYQTGMLYNNIAVVYKNSKQYDKALSYFGRILKSKVLRKNDPWYYALVLDNYSHTKFLLNQTDSLPELYYKALKICDSVDDQYDAIYINIHLSEFYKSINNIDSTKYRALVAKNLAEKFNNDDYLKALLNLAKVEDDSLSVKYFDEYIALEDSLIKNERLIRNKFAKIRYETKEIEKRNEKISKERLYLIILSAGLLLTIFLTYIVITQRARNKELRLNQLQQEANEEIYGLMLVQQEKVREGRSQEKKRISEELHDGILGRLFGTRLSLDSLNNSTTDKAVEARANYIDELKTIEQEIREISHDLNSNFVSEAVFFEMIETLVENQTQAFKLSYDLKKDSSVNWDEVSNKTKINLYRIIQETLQNIYKHANATHVKVNFKLTNGFINMQIEDNGSGFDINKTRKGIGIKNIYSRVEQMDGHVEIISKENKGTKIKIKVPE